MKKLFVAAVCCTSGLAQAAAWNQGRGHSYLKLSYNTFGATQRFDRTGERKSLADAAFLGEGFGRLVSKGTVHEHSVHLYGEYGVGGRVDVFGSLAVRSSSTRYVCGTSARPQRCDEDSVAPPGSTATTRNTGVGDIELGGKLGVWDAPVVATSLAVLIPTYSTDVGKLRVHDQNLFNDRSPLGTGRLGLEARLHAGMNLGPGWLGASTGYRVRTGGYADWVPYRVEGGGPIYRIVSGSLALEGFVPVGGSRDDAQEPPLDEQVSGPAKVLHPSREEIHKLLPSVAIALWRGLSLELGGQWVFAGRRTNAGWGVEAGFSWKR